jgi:hypothetical protein
MASMVAPGEPPDQGHRQMTMLVLRRAFAVLGVLLAVATAFAVGVVVAQRSSDDPSVRLARADLGSGRSCSDLLQWYVDHGVRRVTAWGWSGPVVYGAVPSSGTAAGPTVGSAQPGAESRVPGSVDRSTTSRTGTNVQEAGVDEPDIAKAADGLLVRVVDDTLTTYDVSGRKPRELGSAPLLDMSDPTLLLVGHRVVAIGAAATPSSVTSPWAPVPQATWVQTFDVSDPARPRSVDSRRYDGALVAARQTGSDVHLVLSTGLPQLRFVTPTDGKTVSQALQENRDVVRRSTLADWLPTVSVEGGVIRQAVTCQGVAVPATYGGLGTLTVIGVDPATPGSAQVTAVATGSGIAYVSPGHLYVATPPPTQACEGCMSPMTQAAPDTPVPSSSRTLVYAFGLHGTAATYEGSGGVPGTVSSSWSMDGYQGVLRMAVDEGDATAIVLLRPTANGLTQVGRLDGLGVGEQLRAVRWFDTTAVVVTAAQVDPLYVVDLSDPAHPQAEGVLQLPGWSTYLHPVGSHLVLGLGQAGQGPVVVPPPMPLPGPPTPMPVKPEPPSGGGSAQPGSPVTLTPFPKSAPQWRLPAMVRAKATLFDIADPTAPRALSTVRLPKGSVMSSDPQQVTWLPQQNTLLTFVLSGYGDSARWLAAITIHGGTLHQHLVSLSPTSDPTSARTIPLADGRVVLVDGSSVRFLRLS